MRLLLVWLLAATAWAQVPFAPADQSFRVQFPTAYESIVTGPPTYVWAAGHQKPGPVYMLGYYQVPEEELKGGKQFFDDFVKMVLEQNHITEQGRKPVGIGKAAGYDVEGNKLGRPAHARILANLGQSRFYFLITVGDADFAPYFTSFKVK